jgi:hypothetical protein
MPKLRITDISSELIEEYRRLREKTKDYRAVVGLRYGYKI